MPPMCYGLRTAYSQLGARAAELDLRASVGPQVVRRRLLRGVGVRNKELQFGHATRHHLELAEPQTRLDGRCYAAVKRDEKHRAATSRVSGPVNAGVCYHAQVTG